MAGGGGATAPLALPLNPPLRTLFQSNGKIPVVRKLAIMFFMVILFVQAFVKSETKKCAWTITTFPGFSATYVIMANFSPLCL